MPLTLYVISLCVSHKIKHFIFGYFFFGVISFTTPTFIFSHVSHMICKQFLFYEMSFCFFHLLVVLYLNIFCFMKCLFVIYLFYIDLVF
jgi:hypothetical protein